MWNCADSLGDVQKEWGVNVARKLAVSAVSYLLLCFNLKKGHDSVKVVAVLQCPGLVSGVELHLWNNYAYNDSHSQFYYCPITVMKVMCHRCHTTAVIIGMSLCPYPRGVLE